MAVFRAFSGVLRAIFVAIFVCVLHVNVFAVSCEDNPLLRDPGYVNMPAEALGIGFEAMCSATEGSRYDHGTPDGEHGQHCWCRVNANTCEGCSDFEWAWVYVNNFDEMGRECDNEACLETCNELANSGEEGDGVRSSLYSIDCESDTDPEDPQQDGFNIQYNGGGATGGSAPSTPTFCVLGTTCRAPANTYIRSGYSFIGWHCTVVGGADCSTPAFNDGDDLSRLTGINAGDTITLTAEWTPRYTLTYNCNNSGAGGNAPSGGTYDYNTSVRTASNVGSCVAPSGQQFAGRWNCGGTSVSAGSSFRITANTTCNAQWEQIPQQTYTVTYDCNSSQGGSGNAPVDNRSYESGTTVTTVSNNTCTAPTGADFSGWICGDMFVSPGSTFQITANTTCVSQWGCEIGSHLESSPLSSLTSSQMSLGATSGLYSADMWQLHHGSNWDNDFTYGRVDGTSMCSTTSGSSVGSIGNPVDVSGDYCWCRVTQFTPTADELSSAFLHSDAWVYAQQISGCDLTHCSYTCSLNSSGTDQNAIRMRGALYDSVYRCELNTYTVNYVLNNGQTRAPTTVTYNTTFSVSLPSRYGYEFIGWNITGMDNNTHYYGNTSSSDGLTQTNSTSLNNVMNVYFKNLRSTSGNVTFTANWQEVDCPDGQHVENSPLFNMDTSLVGSDFQFDLENEGNTWHDTFSYGTVYGEAKRSVTSGQLYMPMTGNPSDTTGSNCWCRVVGFAPTGGSYMSLSSLPWVLGGTAEDSQQQCNLLCSEMIIGGGESSDLLRHSLYNTYECVTDQYTLTYDCGDGTGAISTSVTNDYGTVINTLSNATGCTAQSGYQFSGQWDCNGNIVNAGNSVTLTEDIQCTAQWSSLPFHVTYSCINPDTTIGSGSGSIGSGSEPVDNTNYSGDGTDYAPVLSLSGCSATGYTASEWICSDTQGGSMYYDPSVYDPSDTDTMISVTDNISCVPAWEENPRCYSIRFNPNGGTLGGVNTVYAKNGASTIYSDSGCSTTATMSTTATLANNTFNGWWTATSGGNAVYNSSLALQSGVTNYTDAGGNWQLSDNITLFAQWSPDTYTLTYDCGTGGGTPPSGGTYNYNTSVTTPATSGTCTAPSDYVFDNKWNCTNSVGDIVAGNSFNLTGNTTCTAQWKQKCHSIKFDANGGNISGASTVYAKNGASTIYSDSGCSTTATMSTTATLASNTFNGWWTTTSGGNTVYDASLALQSGVSGYTDNSGRWALSNDETIIYAHWTPDSYTLTYDCGTANGTVTDSNSPYTYPNLTTTTASSNGCTPGTNEMFAYWSCSVSGGTPTSYAENTSITLTGNTICTAQWSQYPMIVFDANGGTIDSGDTTLYVKTTADSSDLYTNPPAYTTVGTIPVASRWTYDFDGWWTDPNNGVKVIDNNRLLVDNVAGYTNSSREWLHTITGTHTLYAHWTITQIRYSVTYFCNGAGTPPTDTNSPYLSGASVTALANNSCNIPNGTFVNWDCNGTLYNVGATIAEHIASNITCVAQYTCDANYTPTDSPLNDYTNAGNYPGDPGDLAHSTVNVCENPWWFDIKDSSNNTTVGRITGIGRCSVTSGSYSDVSYTEPSTTSGAYCWCNVNGWTPTGGSLQNISYLPWIMVNSGCNSSQIRSYCDGDADKWCARQCAEAVMYNNRLTALSGFGCVPDLIYLNWLTNSGVFNSGESNPGQCRIGTLAGQSESISPIYAPHRTGYNFIGWKVTGHNNTTP